MPLNSYKSMGEKYSELNLKMDGKLDNDYLIIKTIILSNNSTIGANGQLYFECNTPANKIDGYQMRFAVGVCYKNYIATGNFTNTFVLFVNHSSVAASPVFQATCLYTKLI